MQTQIFNKTFEQLNINPTRFKMPETDKQMKMDRRISVDTYNVERSETDSYMDDFLDKRAQPGDKKPAFEVFCENYGVNNSGEYIRKLEGREIFFFRCPMGHKFMLTKKQVLSGVWCNNCTKIYNNIQKQAEANEGEVLSSSLSRSMRLRCKLDHEFELNYKKAQHRWCKSCSKDNKRKLKDLIEKENKRIEDEKCRMQVS